jgi:small multidrug resistance pump
VHRRDGIEKAFDAEKFTRKAEDLGSSDRSCSGFAGAEERRRFMTGWLYLICAILLEVAGTTCMKLSQGFTKVLPSLLLFLFYGLSFIALTFCVRRMDVSLAYAFWAGLGTALIAVIGIIYFKEPVSTVKLVCLALIILGAVGLNLTSHQH